MVQFLSKNVCHSERSEEPRNRFTGDVHSVQRSFASLRMTESEHQYFPPSPDTASPAASLRILMPLDVPMRVAPAATIFCKSASERTPPEAFTPIPRSRTMRDMSETSSTV